MEGGQDGQQPQSTKGPGFLRRLFKRGESSNSPSEQPVESDSTIIVPKEEQKTPEQLRDDLSKDLGHLAEMNLNILDVRGVIGDDHELNRRFEKHNKTNENKFNNYKEYGAWLKSQEKAWEKERGEVSKDLIDRMEAARDQLGDFCVVVGEGEKRGVVLLSPVRSIISTSIYSPEAEAKVYGLKSPGINYPNSIATDRLKPYILYTKEQDQEDVFIITKYGLQKLAIRKDRRYTPNEDNLKRPENRHFPEGVANIEWSSEDRVGDVSMALYAVINGMEKTGRSREADETASSFRYILTEGMYTLNDDRKESLYEKFSFTQPYYLATATAGVDAQVALADSIDQAQKKKARGPTGNPIYLYDQNHRVK